MSFLIEKVKEMLEEYQKENGTLDDKEYEKLFVHLADTPYYADGPKSEPLAHKDILVSHLENEGFTLDLWEGLKGHPISELYSKFILVYKNAGRGIATGDQRSYS